MIFGSGVWFAPYKYPGGEKWFGPYFSKGDTGRIDLTMDYIQGLKIGEHGYAFLVTQSGLYAASPDADANMKKKITESPDPKRQELGNKIMGLTEPAHFMTDAFGEDAYVVALPIAATGLHLVLVAPTADYSGPIHTAIATNVIAALVVILLLTGAIYVIFERRIERPIQHLLASAEKIADGDLTAEQSLQNMNNVAESVSEMAMGVQQQKGHIDDAATSVGSIDAMNSNRASLQEAVEQMSSIRDRIDGARTAITPRTSSRYCKIQSKKQPRLTVGLPRLEINRSYEQ